MKITRRGMRLAIKLFKVLANKSKRERYEFYRDVWHPCEQKILDKTDTVLGIENLDRWNELNALWDDWVFAEMLMHDILGPFDKCRNALRKVKPLFA